MDGRPSLNRLDSSNEDRIRAVDGLPRRDSSCAGTLASTLLPWPIATSHTVVDFIKHTRLGQSVPNLKSLSARYFFTRELSTSKRIEGTPRTGHSVMEHGSFHLPSAIRLKGRSVEMNLEIHLVKGAPLFNDTCAMTAADAIPLRNIVSVAGSAASFSFLKSDITAFNNSLSPHAESDKSMCKAVQDVDEHRPCKS